MSRFSTTPALRWVVPGAAAAAVASVVTISGVVVASADAGLAPRSAAQLLADVAKAKVDGMSGTVVQRAELGLPELPGLSRDSSEFSSMVSGTHTLRVWYSGPDKARFALMGTLGESDLIRNGNDVWLWSSEQRTAAHLTMTGHDAARRAPADLPMSPQEAVDDVLAKIGPTTQLSTSRTARVAGRAAYQLVVSPREASSLIASVRVAVDGALKVPLRVQVFTKGDAEPAFEVGFTSVEFTRPEAAQFRFNPPAGTQVEEVTADTLKALMSRAADAKPTAAQRPTVVGSGWTAVVVAKMPAVPAGNGPSDQSGPQAGQGGQGADWRQVLARLPKVSGDWGSGRLLKSRLLTVVVTDDGRVAAGAVTPATVYAALK